MSEQKDRLLARVHIVEGLLRVLDDRFEFLALVETSYDKRAALETLISGWGMTEIQARHALDITFSRATKLGREALVSELAELRSAIDEAG